MTINVVVRDRISRSIEGKLSRIERNANRAATAIATLDAAMRSSGNAAVFVGATNSVQRFNRALQTSNVNAFRQQLTMLNSSVRALRGSFMSSILQMRTFISSLLLLGAAFELASNIDTFQNIENQISQTADSVQQLEHIMTNLFAIAERTRSPVDSLAKSFRRTDNAMKRLGVSQKESLQITETMAGLLTLSGTTSQEASSAMLQLSQAFNKGKLDGDEFRSVAELMPEIIGEIANVLGISSSEIYDYSRNGAISADVLRQAFINMSEDVATRLEAMPRTAGQAFQQFKNAVTQTFGALDDQLGITEKIVTFFDFLRNNIPLVAAGLLTLVTAFTALSAAVAAVGIVSFIASLNPIAIIFGSATLVISAATLALIGFLSYLSMYGNSINLGVGSNQKFIDVLNAIGGQAIPAVSAVLAQLASDIYAISNALFPVIGHFNQAFPTASQKVDFFAGLFVLSMKLVISAIAGASAAITQFTRNTINNAKKIYNEINYLIALIIRGFIAMAKVVLELFDKLFEDLLERAGDFAKTMASVLKLAGFDELAKNAEAASTVLDAMKSGLDMSPTIESIKEYGATFREEMENNRFEIGENASEIEAFQTMHDIAFKQMSNAISAATEERRAFEAMKSTNPDDLLRQPNSIEQAKQRMQAFNEMIDQAAQKGRDYESQIALMNSQDSVFTQEFIDNARQKIAAQLGFAEAYKEAAAMIEQAKIQEMQSQASPSDQVLGGANGAVDIQQQMFAMQMLNSMFSQLQLTISGIQATGLNVLRQLIPPDLLPVIQQAAQGFTFLNQAINFIPNALLNTNTGLNSLFTPLLSLKTIATEMLNSVFTSVQAVGQEMTNTLFKGTQKAGEGFGAMDQGISAADSTMNTFGTSGESAVTGVGNSSSSAGNTMGSSFQQASNTATSNVSNFARQVINDLDAITSAANRAAAAVARIGSGGGGFGGFGGGIGFASGGYTGNIPKNAVAGVVHGQEYVMPADATRRYRPLLEAMRSGNLSGGSVGGSMVGGIGGVNVTVQNYSGANIEVQQLSENDIRIIARQESMRTVERESPNIVARELRNPNSRVSKSLQQNTKTERRR